MFGPKKMLLKGLVATISISMSVLPSITWGAVTPTAVSGVTWSGNGGKTGGGTILHGSVSPSVTSGQAKKISNMAEDREMRLAFVLKPRQLNQLSAMATSGQKITSAQYQSDFAPSSNEINDVTAFAKINGLQVVQQSTNVILVSGTSKQVRTALHVTLNEYSDNQHTFYATANDPTLPSNILSDISGVVGLNEVDNSIAPITPKSTNDQGQSAFFTPDAVRTSYGLIPAYGNQITGAGRKIGVLIDGDFQMSDIQTFSQTFGIPFDSSNILKKQVVQAQTPPALSIESTLDVEWAHTIAPGANISVYETGDFSQANMITGLDAAINDNPDVINMSFGGAEIYNSPNDINSWHTLFLTAVAKGITPIASSGDNGAYGRFDPTKSVSYPASDPLVLSVGGTSLDLNPDNSRAGETSWDESNGQPWDPGQSAGSGGGCSTVFADMVGNQQACAGMRGVPDISMLAHDLQTFYNGQWTLGSGTSYSAPMWSGIVALSAQKSSHNFGWIDPSLNSLASAANTSGLFEDITNGNNGVYNASSGWDAVTGWGTPSNGWLLINSIADQPVNLGLNSTTISGVVVGSSASSAEQTIVKGVGTVDLIGNGFGANSGTVTLKDQTGNSYVVPIIAWSDNDITLDIDGLFTDSQRPTAAGSYSVIATTSQNTNSNPISVKLSDFFNVTDDGPTSVSNNTDSSPSFKMITLEAEQPDGTFDSSYNGVATVNVMAPTNEPVSNLVVQQDGQALTPDASGAYQVTVTNGKASVQLSSSLAGTFTILAQANGVLVSEDATAQFNSGQATTLESLSNASIEPVNHENPVFVSLVDTNGNLVNSTDSIQVTVNNASGNVFINKTPIATNSPYSASLTYNDPSSGNVTNGVVQLNVQDDKAETVSLTVTDTTDSTIHSTEIPLTFSSASQVELSTPNPTPISVGSENPNWQPLKVSVVDDAGNPTSFSGDCQLLIDSSQPVTVEQYVSDKWQPLTASSNGTFSIDVSSGSASLQVSSQFSGDVSYAAQLDFGDGPAVSNSATGTFTPGDETDLAHFVQFPHMATSPKTAPQYAPVEIVALDGNGNITESADKLVIKETDGGPKVTLAEQGQSGMKNITASNGMWNVTLGQNGPVTLYITSVVPGIASFTVSDITNPQVGNTSFQVDFVNSQPSQLKVAPIKQSSAASPQSVNVYIADQNGQTVINSNDKIGLKIGKHNGTISVSDGNGKVITPDQGVYSLTAQAGVVTFAITDNQNESLNYTLSDLTETTVQDTTALGIFGSSSPGGGNTSGGNLSPSVGVNQPIVQTNSEVKEMVDTKSQPVQVNTKDNSVNLLFSQGSFNQPINLTISQVSPSASIPREMSQATPSWSFDTGGISLTQPVQVQFKVNVTENTPPNQLAIYTLDGDQWKFVEMAQPTSTSGMVSAILPHFSIWTVMALKNTFPDVPTNHWSFKSIEELMLRGVISGYPDGHFAPTEHVTRAQFITMLDKAIGIKPASSVGKSPFHDVEVGTWYMPYLNAAYDAGLIKGDGAGNANPNQVISRQEAAVILAGALGPKTITSGPVGGFTDSNDIAFWASSAIQLDLSAGLFQGYPDGSFKPMQELERDQAASLIVGLIHHNN